MKKIFERGDFSNYKVKSLNEASGEIQKSVYGGLKTTVFISHKHDDLEELKDFIGFLEREYWVKAYIDSQDASMPFTTSGETAIRIKNRIKACSKFILLATDGAIESKWCNWELGYGDAQKYDRNCIALFPIKNRGTMDSSYKGNEYMQIYPHIVYCDILESYRHIGEFRPGYYVRGIDGSMELLEHWLA